MLGPHVWRASRVESLPRLEVFRTDRFRNQVFHETTQPRVDRPARGFGGSSHRPQPDRPLRRQHHDRGGARGDGELRGRRRPLGCRQRRIGVLPLRRQLLRWSAGQGRGTEHEPHAQLRGSARVLESGRPRRHGVRWQPAPGRWRAEHDQQRVRVGSGRHGDHGTREARQLAGRRLGHADRSGLRRLVHAVVVQRRRERDQAGRDGLPVLGLRSSRHHHGHEPDRQGVGAERERHDGVGQRSGAGRLCAEWRPAVGESSVRLAG
ncbi:MAG: hypothetical protein IPH13_03660 [Planctomycetes bacterium]|nr:hypothetical protein [Planctomycetota bacterium]MCC7173305.1 hypothetical protein [Planctomycetota bacterium]